MLFISNMAPDAIPLSKLKGANHTYDDLPLFIA